MIGLAIFSSKKRSMTARILLRTGDIIKVVAKPGVTVWPFYGRLATRSKYLKDQVLL